MHLVYPGFSIALEEPSGQEPAKKLWWDDAAGMQPAGHQLRLWSASVAKKGVVQQDILWKPMMCKIRLESSIYVESPRWVSNMDFQSWGSWLAWNWVQFGTATVPNRKILKEGFMFDFRLNIYFQLCSYYIMFNIVTLRLGSCLDCGLGRWVKVCQGRKVGSCFRDGPSSCWTWHFQGLSCWVAGAPFLWHGMTLLCNPFPIINMKNPSKSTISKNRTQEVWRSHPHISFEEVNHNLSIFSSKSTSSYPSLSISASQPFPKFILTTHHVWGGW